MVITDRPLGSPFRGGCCLRADYIIPQTVVTVHHVQNLRLCQEYEVVVTLIEGTKHLWEAEAVAVPYSIRPRIDSREARWAALQQRKRQAK